MTSFGGKHNHAGSLTVFRARPRCSRRPGPPPEPGSLTLAELLGRVVVAQVRVRPLLDLFRVAVRRTLPEAAKVVDLVVIGHRWRVRAGRIPRHWSRSPRHHRRCAQDTPRRPSAAEVPRRPPRRRAPSLPCWSSLRGTGAPPPGRLRGLTPVCELPPEPGSLTLAELLGRVVVAQVRVRPLLDLFRVAVRRTLPEAAN